MLDKPHFTGVNIAHTYISKDRQRQRAQNSDTKVRTRWYDGITHKSITLRVLRYANVFDKKSVEMNHTKVHNSCGVYISECICSTNAKRKELYLMRKYIHCEH